MANAIDLLSEYGECRPDPAGRITPGSRPIVALMNTAPGTPASVRANNASSTPRADPRRFAGVDEVPSPAADRQSCADADAAAEEG